MKRKNPERVAWLVIFGAFGVFLTLCAAIPLSAQSYLLYSTDTQQAKFEVLSGTAQVQELNSLAPMAVTASTPMLLTEGSTAEVDENSKAMLTLFDGSTVQLFPSTQVVLREMRVPKFEWGQQPLAITIEQTRGRTRIGAAQLYSSTGEAPGQRVFIVKTRHLQASLRGGSGSYGVDVSSDSSQISVRDGVALVSSMGKSVSVSRGQRTVARPGAAPLDPLPAALDLIANGDFVDPLDRRWDLLEGLNPSNLVPGMTEKAPFTDRQALHIVRTNSNQTSAITGRVQIINKDVSDYPTLRLSAEIRLHFQSLSGGGSVSSEYPIILRLKYRDQYGSDAEKVWGFYYQNTMNNQTNNGILVPLDVWYPFETQNLYDILDPKPYIITSLQIYASGWDYDAYVSNVHLNAE